MLPRVICGVLCLWLTGCTAFWQRPPPARAVTVTPVDVTTTYIATFGHHYTRGEFAIVEVCVTAEGTIASTRILVSSTEKTFDDAALDWARQAHYEPQRVNGRAVFGCEDVRVELNQRRDNTVPRGADSALG